MLSPRLPNPATAKKIPRTRSSPALPLARLQGLPFHSGRAALTLEDQNKGGTIEGARHSPSLLLGLLRRSLYLLIVLLCVILALQHSTFASSSSHDPRGTPSQSLWEAYQRRASSERPRGRMLVQVEQSLQKLLEAQGLPQALGVLKGVVQRLHEAGEKGTHPPGQAASGPSSQDGSGLEHPIQNLSTSPTSSKEETTMPSSAPSHVFHESTGAQHPGPREEAASRRSSSRKHHGHNRKTQKSETGKTTVGFLGIPGSRLASPELAERYRKRLQCISTEGTWAVDPTPRLLPWPLPGASYGACGKGQGWLSGRAADRVVLRKLRAKHWRVRPSLKYKWQADEGRCGKGAAIEDVDGMMLSRELLEGSSTHEGDTSGGYRHPGKERVLLVVGDSLQRLLAVSMYNTLRMGLGDRANEEVVPLVSRSLPCHVDQLAHKMVCWGAHFFAKSQPGMKMLFVRNDYLSLREDAEWSKDGRNIELPWMATLKAILEGQQEWREGGSLFPPRHRRLRAEDQALEEKQIRMASRRMPMRPVIILNKGMHFTPDDVFFPELNRTMLATRALCPDCLIIFRNTPAGHKGCSAVSLPLARRPSSQNLPYNWTGIGEQSRNPLTREIVESVGAVFLDVEAMTSLRADGHTGWNTQGKEDCVHYCSPGPVDHWTRLLFHSLHELLGQEAHGA